MLEARQPLITHLADPLAQAQALLGAPMRQVEAVLNETVQSTVELIPEVSHHLIDSGGKRIRPTLLLLCELAAGGNGQGVSLAVAAELLHSATLLHDDVVDRGHLRRGVPSAPRVYGNSAAVLVGDFLLSRAFNLVVQHGDLALLDELSRVLTAMAEGEVLQLIRSGKVAVSQPDYVGIISGKTAGLFSWCCRAGASLGEGGSTAAADFGRSFGMAFQITDDILDYTSGPSESGKDLANDLLQGKVTLPLLMACEEDPNLLALVEATAAAGPSEPESREILSRVLSTRAVARARLEAGKYVEQAVTQLKRFPEGPAVRCLADLSRHVVDRAG